MFGSKTQRLSNENVIYDFLKGLLVATLISLGLVVLFAFCMKWFLIADDFIAPATLVIKGISVLAGSVVAVKGKSKGLVKGLSFGAIYVAVAFLVFWMLSGSFSIGVSTLLDVLFASLLGGIVGIIKVNKRWFFEKMLTFKRKWVFLA